MTQPMAMGLSKAQMYPPPFADPGQREWLKQAIKKRKQERRGHRHTDAVATNGCKVTTDTIKP